MRSIWRGIANTIFWAYDRGSWPYDVLVVVILIFVLATPRNWFHDRPQTGVGASSSSSVQFVSEDSASQTRVYRLGASALSPEKRTAHPTPELERETHDILGRTVDDLKNRTFTVLRIDPVVDANGVVMHYDVTVHW
ncbi:MAG TPA: hypothetical protein VK757_03290 [Candidatus Acidoferrum sp.]|jgi:hypothetical protein|nr:hypothetical protein [Candidatus Acidoferrum sp.]